MNKILFFVVISVILILFYLFFYDDRIYLSEFEKSGQNKPLYYYVQNSVIDKDFREVAMNILQNSGWNSLYNLTPTDEYKKAYIYIFLVHTEVLSKYTDHNDNNYDKDGRKMNYSITSQSRWDKPVILIDAENWKYGVKRSGLTLDQYREYVITHEFGHALSFDHVKCNKNTIKDGRCPVMNQSTRGCTEYLCGYQVIDDKDRMNKIPGSYFR
jgi:hypothetical protein